MHLGFQKIKKRKEKKRKEKAGVQGCELKDDVSSRMYVVFDTQEQHVERKKIKKNKNIKYTLSFIFFYFSFFPDNTATDL